MKTWNTILLGLNAFWIIPMIHEGHFYIAGLNFGAAVVSAVTIITRKNE